MVSILEKSGLNSKRIVDKKLIDLPDIPDRVDLLI
jgi:hypothetical protein